MRMAWSGQGIREVHKLKRASLQELNNHSFDDVSSLRNSLFLIGGVLITEYTYLTTQTHPEDQNTIPMGNEPAAHKRLRIYKSPYIGASILN
jgi:hypothetical protein